MKRRIIEEGYKRPNDGQNVIVELENGMLTGAIYRPVAGRNLEDLFCFQPVGVCSEDSYCCVEWTSKPVAYFVGDITE